jgi:hypothetical protein
MVRNSLGQCLRNGGFRRDAYQGPLRETSPSRFDRPQVLRPGPQCSWSPLFALVVVAAIWSLLLATTASAQTKFNAANYEALAPANSAATITPGTKITLQNWTQYRRFMPVGMQALFSGKYPWKAGSGPEYTIEVGPTASIPLSRKYLADTEKYSSGVRLKKVSTGGYTIENYVAGIPFPNPTEPEIGIKLMYDTWFPYSPFVFEMLFITTSIDRFRNSSTSTSDAVIWRLNHISDEGMPVSKYAPGYLEADRFETLEPQQYKYTTQLSLQPDDPARVQESYIFDPSIRRSIRMSTSARCSAMTGSDFVQDDNGSGFFFKAVDFTAKYLGLRRVLAVVHLNPAGLTPQGYQSGGTLPGWPRPQAGQWQLRDVYVIDVTPLPSAGDYCYSHKVGYLDKQTYALTWVEMYGRDSNLEKVWPIFQSPRRIGTGEEVMIPEANSSTMYNLKNDHATVALQASPVRVDGDAPADLQDASVAASSGGLGQIMK